MRKESPSLYIIRWLMSAALLGFLIMLYWSQTIIEENMIEIQKQIVSLNTKFEEMRRLPQHEEIAASKDRQSRPHIKDDLPNLLQEDHFYKVMLPKLLPNAFEASGKLAGAAVGKPNNLHPFSNWANVAEWNRQCISSVADQAFGIYETLTPDLAIKIEERTRADGQGQEYWVHLRDNVFWEPLLEDFFSDNIRLSDHFKRRHQVVANDIKFYWEAVMNPFVEQAGAISLRTYLDGIESIEVIDPLTLVVRWKTKEIAPGTWESKYISRQWTGSLMPLASFVYQYLPDGTKIIEEEKEDTYRTSSVWAQNFNNHWAKNVIISCGPYVFEKMTERSIYFRRNPNYHNKLRVLVDSQSVAFKDTPDAVWQAFKAGQTDTYGLEPNQVAELDDFLTSGLLKEQKNSGKDVRRLDYVGRSYYYIGWNFKTPYFNSKKVRQALTMAIDRVRIIDQYLNELGIPITGPFFRYSPSYNDLVKPWPYDPEIAARMLAEEGWYDSDGDGILDKEIDGKRIPFSFTLTYYVKNPTTKAICEYVSMALHELGIECALNGVDIADLSATFEDKSFDALSLGWGLGSPPEDPKQLWHSSGANVKGSSNAVGFSNAEADRIIEALAYESDAEKRIALYHRFHEIIHEEAPYTFLYTPKVALLYRQYLQNVFIPKERQDLIPGASVAEPLSQVFWIKNDG